MESDDHVRESSPAAHERPVGLTAIAVLNFIGGVTGLIAPLLFTRADGIDAKLYLIGIYPASPVPTCLFAAYKLASSLGMWRGAPWTWKAAVMLCIWQCLRFGEVLLALSVIHVRDHVPLTLMQNPIAESCGMLLLNVLLLIYYFRPRVLKYFRLEFIQQKRILGQLVMQALGVSMAYSLLKWTMALSQGAGGQ